MTHEPLNVIYIVCHDLGKHLGCYGVPVESPNLDTFAAEGVKFTSAFCASPCCSPSRGCAMTGKYAHNNGQIGLSHMG
ncbi:MAG: sulfatase-like hydrolase/transferase [Bacillota bacterium]